MSHLELNLANAILTALFADYLPRELASTKRRVARRTVPLPYSGRPL